MVRFKHIIALDIVPHVEGFLEKSHTIFQEAPHILHSADELFTVSKEQLRNVDALLISIYEELKEEHLALLPSLLYIGILGTSTAKIPLKICESRSIKVCPVQEYCDFETAEWVIGEIIKHFREQNPPKSVYEKSLGLIGVGGVGRQVLKTALALGMRVFFNATRAHPDLERLGAQALSKEEIFSQCDVISFHTPPHYVWLNEHDLDRTKFGAVLINTCFGKISRDDALEKFLDLRKDISLRMDSIAAMSYDLAQRAIIDAHAAYDTVDSEHRLIRKFFENIEQKTPT